MCEIVDMHILDFPNIIMYIMNYDVSGISTYTV